MTGKPRTGKPQTGESRTGKPKHDESRTGEPRTGEPRTGEPRTGQTAASPEGRPPALARSYLRALARGRRRGRDPEGPLPPAEYVLAGVAVDSTRLASYARVCGFPADGAVPPTYPHVLAFPAALALMTSPDFPWPALGLVHVANRITVGRAIGPGERLTLRVRADHRHDQPAGAAFDIVTRAVAGGEPVWESVSTYLSRRRGPSGPRRPAPPEVAGESQLWPVPADTGRRYAAVSGDRNPIHLHALTARPFGFRTAIAHGMWAKARVLAALGPRLPGAFTADVTFRSPVPLPGQVRLTTDGTRFALTSPDGGRTHLYGEVKTAE